MTAADMSFLQLLKADATDAQAREMQYRQRAAREIVRLESERAFAFRRFNLMNAVVDTVAQAESEDVAVANGLAALRGKLGWGTDSEARSEVLTRFTPVTQAVFRHLSSPAGAPVEAADAVQTALAGFETWYAETHPAAFWVLFEQYIPETPRVDF